MLAALWLCGCIIIPTPWVKDKYSVEDISCVQAGVSTKDDVLKEFGEPDIIWETERVFVYKWQRLWAILFVGGGYTGAFGGLTTDKAVLVFFDETDHIKRIEIAAKSASESYGDFLIRWRDQKRNN